MDLTWIARAKSTLPIGSEELLWIKDQVMQVCSMSEQVDTRRAQAENARYCKWDGQSADGRKWRENLGKEPFPFNGCSDQRVPLVDMITNEDVALCSLAGIRMLAAPPVKMTEGTDAARAGYMEQALRWMLQTQMGLECLREMVLVLNYVHGDVPAVCVLQQTWERDPAVVLEELTIGDVLARIDELTGNAVHPDTGETASVFLSRALQTPGLEDEAAELLTGVLEPLGVSQGEMKTMVNELKTKGTTQFPRQYYRQDRVKWRALRAFEDIWWDVTRRNEDDVEMWFLPRWLTRRECRKAAKTEGWSDSFLEKLCGNDRSDNLGNPGQSLFGSGYGTTQQTVFTSGYSTTRDDDHANEYEVVDVYFRATDGRGRTGWYMCTVSAVVDEAAAPGKLLGYMHGCSPFTVFQREWLRSNMADSRGVPAAFESFQCALKLEIDMHNDRTQMGTFPPLIGPEARLGKFRLQPAGYIPETRPGEFRFMPQPPGGARDDEAHQQILWRMVNEAAGRDGEGVPESLVTLLKQFKVAVFLGQLGHALKRTLQLMCQYMTPERTMRLLNVADDPLPRTVEEIQAGYDCSLWMDARDLVDSEHLVQMAKVMIDAVVQLDRDSTIDTTPWAQALAKRLDPQLAAMSMTGQQVALDREIEEEKGAFAAIAGGVEPRFLEGPNHNYMARLHTLQAQEQANIEDIQQNWTQRKKDLLSRRKKNLGQGLQQQENAQTGRTGVEAEA